MRHTLISSESPDLPISAFRKALGKNRPATLEGGKGGSAPSAPDPYSVANAQTNLFQQNAAFNKALNLGNYSNPFGSQSSGISGFDPATGAPIYQTNVSANPQLQQQLNNLLSTTGNNSWLSQDAINGIRNANLGISGINNQVAGLLPQYQALGSQLDYGAAKNAQQQGQDAAYAAQKQYLDPQFSQQEESLQAKLAAQGLAPGSQAFGNAFQNFNNQKQQAYSNAQNQAILTGSQLGTQNLQNQISGINTQAGLLGQQANTLGQQAGLFGQNASLYNNQSALGQIPYSNLQAISGLIPGYTGIGQAGANPADIASAFNNQYLGQLGQYNARQQAQNANMSSLGGLLGQGLNAYRGYNTLNGLFTGNGLSGYGSALSSVSPGAAGYLGDLFGSSIGGVYGPSTQAGLDALIGSFSGGSGATASTGAAGAGAAGAGEAGGSGVAGLSGGSAGLAAATALPFAIAAYGMLNGIFGGADNGTPYTQANDAWTNAIARNPALLQQFGQGDVSKYMQGMFGGSQWTPDQYQRAIDMLSAQSGGGTLLGGALGWSDTDTSRGG